MLYLGVIRTFVTVDWITYRKKHIPANDMPRFLHAIRDYAHELIVIVDEAGNGTGVNIDERVIATYNRRDAYEMHCHIDRFVLTVSMFLQPIEVPKPADHEPARPAPGRFRVELHRLGLHVPAQTAHERTGARLSDMGVDCFVDDEGHIVAIAWTEATNLDELFATIKIDIEVISQAHRSKKHELLIELERHILAAEDPTETESPLHRSA